MTSTETNTAPPSCLTDEDRAGMPPLRALEIRAAEGVAFLSGGQGWVRRRVVKWMKARPGIPTPIFDIATPEAVDEPDSEAGWQQVPPYARDIREAQKLIDALAGQHYVTIQRTGRVNGRTQYSALVVRSGDEGHRGIWHASATHPAEAITRAFVQAVLEPKSNMQEGTNG